MQKLLIAVLFIVFGIISPGISDTSDQNPKIKNVGIPLMMSYRTQDYSSKSVTYGSQNYDVLQGDDGKMYFANIEGLLIFDGVKWKRHRLPGRAGAYSLSKVKDGTIYVGGINEIGYLHNNANGQLEYRSLKDKLGKASNESLTSKYSFMMNDEIVFLDENQIFIFNHITKEMKVIENAGSNRKISVINKKLYSYKGATLYKLNGSKWDKIRPSSLQYSSQTSHLLSVDINAQQSIIITENGFYDFKTEKKISTHAKTEAFLKNTTLRSSSLLFDKYISICTTDGMLITDLSGNPIQLLDQKKGLTDNVTFNAIVDNSGLLWVGTNSGIDKIDISSPFTLFDKRMGIDGNVSFIEQYENDIYMATATGTYRQEWNLLTNPLQIASFEKLNPLESRLLLKSQNELFSLASSATLELKNGAFEKIRGTGEEKFWVAMKFRGSEDMLLGSANGKILHLSKENGAWSVKKHIDPLLPTILFMAEGDGNDIWVCNRSDVFKLTYDKEKGQFLTKKKYDTSHGLPYNFDNYVFSIDSAPCFTTLKGIYRYDAQTDRFVKNENFISTVGDLPLLRMTEDSEGNIYCLSDGYLVLNKTDDGYKMKRILNEKLINYNPFNIKAFDSANVLLPTFNAFVHVDPTVTQIQHSFETKITNIKSVGSKDTLYYDGYGELPEHLLLPPTNNATRFSFSAAYYQNIDQTVYKWRLLGSDDTWSDWSSETTKDYTNLPHGAYSFEVIAKNVFFVESSIASIPFNIRAPWYFTTWAYILYGACFIVFMWTTLKLNTIRLQKDKRKLEQIVEERTNQITVQKEKAEQDAKTISNQNSKLIEMDALKGRFFLNISHELRTPLTLIIGIVDEALKGRYGSLNDALYAHLKSSFRNSQRLLKMVNNILDISKLEGGKMQLQASKAKPSEILLKVIDFFASKFYGKNMELKHDISSDSELYIDKDKFETIFINLIANAFKYTDEGGIITVSLSEDNEQMTIIVKDNGIGIPKSDLASVFDRFYQSPHGPSDGGTGLGLALAKELVDLHNGTITVTSEIDAGSKFEVTLLKGVDHLVPDQIIKKEIDAEFIILDDKHPFTDDLNGKSTPELKKKDNSVDEHKEGVLLVEDNSEMSKFIAELLSDIYHVSIVENGQEAIKFLGNHLPDLILTDYLMPVMNGYEMAKEIKKSDKLAYIPMIFLTARTAERDKIDVLNLGVDDYLFKPFSSEELQVRIKNLLNIKKQRVDFITQKSIDPRDIEWKEFPSKLKLDIDDYIKLHIKEEITGADLSTFTSQSERSLYRKVKVNTGLSLMQYIKEYRLRKARTLLEQKEVLTVSEVAYAVGFNYLSHFTKNYKERFGKQPSEYLD